VKAWLTEAAGPPQTLRLADLPEPVPGPGQVRIRVAACGLNHADLLLMEDRYQVRPPRPFAPGAEVAGVVDRLGALVTEPAVGTRVVAVCDWGGLAECITVGVERCMALPATVSFEEAAVLPLAYGTAWYALTDCARLALGETLLVLGAAGGVGLAAVQVGVLRGARIVAAVSSEDKALAARAAGAPLDAAARRALAEGLKAACGAGTDVVLDPVGGECTEPALRTLRRGGRYVVAGFAAGIPSLPLNLVLLKQAVVMGAPWGAVVAEGAPAFRTTLAALLDATANGRLRPLISRRLPLERAREGLEALRGGHVTGKAVVVC
jgi:NADPH2:quinone reductase